MCKYRERHENPVEIIAKIAAQSASPVEASGLGHGIYFGDDARLRKHNWARRTILWHADRFLLNPPKLQSCYPSSNQGKRHVLAFASNRLAKGMSKSHTRRILPKAPPSTAIVSQVAPAQLPPPRKVPATDYKEFVVKTIQPEVSLDLVVGIPKILVFKEAPSASRWTAPTRMASPPTR